MIVYLAINAFELVTENGQSCKIQRGGGLPKIHSLISPFPWLQEVLI